MTPAFYPYYISQFYLPHLEWWVWKDEDLGPTHFFCVSPKWEQYHLVWHLWLESKTFTCIISWRLMTHLESPNGVNGMAFRCNRSDNLDNQVSNLELSRWLALMALALGWHRIPQIPMPFPGWREARMQVWLLLARTFASGWGAKTQSEWLQDIYSKGWFGV